MKMKIATIALALVGFAAVAPAQDIKVMTVDIAEIFDNYYKTAEARERLEESRDEAQAQLEEMQGEGQAMLEELQALREQMENEALSEQARQTAQQEAQAKMQEIQQKQREVEGFQQTTVRSLQQRQQNFQEIMLDEIRQVILEFRRERGADLVLNTSERIGGVLNSVLYTDPEWDATQAVLARLNRNAPASGEASGN